MTTSSPDGQTRVRRYPVAQTETDPRFTFGLMREVAEVLERHGYPRIEAANAADFVELKLALFAFLYTGGGAR